MEIRRFGIDEFDAAMEVIAEAFGFDPDPDEMQLDRQLLDFDRTTAAVDGGRIVGTAASVSFDLTLPGGNTIPAAGLTAVAVLPTHRRRGILRAMMEQQLQDSIDRGEPVSVLWASESIIYQRFGYGPATFAAQLEAEAPAAFGFGIEPDDRVELVGVDEFLEYAAPIYDRRRHDVPGYLSMPDNWWKAVTVEIENRQGGATKRRFVVHHGDDGPDGFMAYRHKKNWEDDLARNEVRVGLSAALSPAAYASLWNYVLNLDLVRTVTSFRVSRDEPLKAMLADPRRVRIKASDGMWLRIVDPVAALAARTYPAGVIRIGLHGGVPFPVDGVYEIESADDGSAECRRVDGEADLEMDVATLGARLLGEHSFATYARAGRVQGTPDAVDRADAMFATNVAPVCPFDF